VGLFHATSCRGGLPRSVVLPHHLSSELTAWRLAAGGLAGGLLSACHADKMKRAECGERQGM